MVSLYALALNDQKSKAHILSSVYAYPYYHQHWSLFAPAPDENFAVYVKYKAGKEEKEWYDLFYQVNSKHQQNRLGIMEAKELSLSTALRYFSSSVPAQTSVIRQTDNNVSFLVLERIIRVTLSQSETKPVSDLKIIIGIRPLKKEAHYHYYKN